MKTHAIQVANLDRIEQKCWTLLTDLTENEIYKAILVVLNQTTWETLEDNMTLSFPIGLEQIDPAESLASNIKYPIVHLFQIRDEPTMETHALCVFNASRMTERHWKFNSNLSMEEASDQLYRVIESSTWDTINDELVKQFPNIHRVDPDPDEILPILHEFNIDDN